VPGSGVDIILQSRGLDMQERQRSVRSEEIAARKINWRTPEID
jgi:hypothetical protein